MPALPRRAVCRVPGSTSNCGSGFDTLGLALQLYNRVEVRRKTNEEPTEKPDLMAANVMAKETAEAYFRESGMGRFPFAVHVEGDVPQARGLGSSVTVRAGILAGLSALCGSIWDRDRLVRVVTRLEGHPDNASASIFGGFTVSRFGKSASELERAIRIEIPDTLRFVVASPSHEVLTSASRSCLPAMLGFDQVVASLNGVSSLVAALATGDFEGLRGTVKDSVHEPHRYPSIPGASASVAEGIDAGAYTGWLSGSGSSVICVCASVCAEAVGAAMKAAFSKLEIDATLRNLAADNGGLMQELFE